MLVHVYVNKKFIFMNCAICLGDQSQEGVNHCISLVPRPQAWGLGAGNKTTDTQVNLTPS